MILTGFELKSWELFAVQFRTTKILFWQINQIFFNYSWPENIQSFIILPTKKLTSYFQRFDKWLEIDR